MSGEAPNSSPDPTPEPVSSAEPQPAQVEAAPGEVDAALAAAQADAAPESTAQAFEPTAMPEIAPATSPSPMAYSESPVSLPDFGVADADESPGRAISMLSDVELDVKIELGRATMLIEDVLKLGDGSVVELDKLAGDPVDVLVNDRLVARGEVLVLNDNFCVRISEIVTAEGEPETAHA